MPLFIRNRRNLIILGGLILIILVGVFFGFKKGLFQKKSSQLSSTSPTQSSSEQVKELLGEVGKLIDLPQGEDPTVATITDINKLKDQPFFSKGANGDKVLIYPKAQKAILYDPVGKRIVDVETINIGSDSAQLNPSPSPSRSSLVFNAKVAVLNGTTVVGLAGRTATNISSKLPQASIVEKGNASSSSYQTSLVVPITDTGKTQAQTLATSLGVQAQTALPSGEAAPSGADIVVIVGNDLAK